MHISEQDREKEFFNILSLVKLASLLFYTILFLNILQSKYSIINIVNGMVIDMKMIVLSTILFILIYLLWYIFSVKACNSKHRNKIQIFESLVFILLFTTLVLFSGSYDSQYKLLYIFIIITSTLQQGMKFGLILSLISSSTILIIDLNFAPKTIVNSYFENDLILIAVFISTAAVLGHYVKMESERIYLKNLHLQELSDEVKEKEKQSRHIQKILFNNELCYNLLFQNSGNAVLVHRFDEIIFANESALKLLNYSTAKDLLNKSLKDLLCPNDITSTYEKLLDLHKKDINTLIFETTAIKSTGELITVKNTSTKFMYEGKSTILTIFHDITSDKKVEKLQKDVEKNIELLNETREINRLTTEFFSNISHELKTPLNVIYSAVQVLLLDRNESETMYSTKHYKYLKIVKQNCFRLTRLINNLLDLTKFDSGFLKLNLEDHNIISIVEDISQSVVPYLESKNINFIFDTEIEEEIIAIDPDKIERIILNLLSNAFKFTSSGGQISIYMHTVNNQIHISVRDTGIGIPSDKLQIIFERFGQVDRALNRSYEGSGIGLSLVKSFVEMHGGTINIHSEVGKGSEFIIMLPIKRLHENSTESFNTYDNNIERINIEFSDIYSDVL